MLRFLLLLLILYFAWKLGRLFSRMSSRSASNKPASRPFDQIEDADFEDVTDPKDPSDKPPDPKQ